MKQFYSIAATASVAIMGGLGASTAFAAVTIPTVAVGNSGNAADPTTGFGSVAYSYNIGTTEVTNAQYAAFLNAVASTDTNNLYNTNMAGSISGITRAGSAGSYTYSVASGRGNYPVNYVSYWDATRFANWLHNGQPVGPQNASTTEGGAYTLTASGITANTITRNAAWQWALPSEDEWYKAAYYQPANQGGDSDNYWLYAISSNTINTTLANYNNSVIGSTTPVGSYAANFYGTFDMAGNVSEWNNTNITDTSRGRLGGAYNVSSSSLRADLRGGALPTVEAGFVGFRVVQIPGPSSVALLALGGLVTARRRRSAC